MVYATCSGVMSGEEVSEVMCCFATSEGFPTTAWTAESACSDTVYDSKTSVLIAL